MRLNKNMNTFIYEFKDFKKYFLSFCTIYLLSFIAIIRANVLYCDDIDRTVDNAASWARHLRYVSEVLSKTFCTNFIITDISPLTQFIAIIFLAFASCILIYIISNNDQFSIIYIISVLPLGVNPYFLQCISYKFDSPYFALSILFSLIPFLYIKYNSKVYIIVSTVMLFLTLMTYQSASGIYLIVLFFILTGMYINGDSVRNILLLFFKSLLSYAISLIIFVLLLPFSSDYAVRSFPEITEIFYVFFNNLSYFYTQIFNDFNIMWKIFSLLIIVSYIIILIFNSKRNLIASLMFLFISLLIISILPFGIYVFINNTIFEPRAMYGVGVIFAIMQLYIVIFLSKKSLLKILPILLSFCFVSYSFTYGNVLFYQQKYLDFRINMVMADLNNLFNNENQYDKIKFSGKSIGECPACKKASSIYPITKRLISDWHIIYVKKHFGLDNISSKASDISNAVLIKETMLHNIYSTDNLIIIDFK